jgi:hypothetical protein
MTHCDIALAMPIQPDRTRHSTMTLGTQGAAMKRREFIALFGSLAATWPLKAEAQQEPRTIAIVGHTMADYGPWAAALVERLDQLGWIEGRTAKIEYR